MKSELMACQTCDGTSAKNNKGCAGCGGYGYVAARIKCPTCDRKGWFRPGCHTNYEGKVYYSMDALEMVCHLERANNCGYCEKKEAAKC